MTIFETLIYYWNTKNLFTIIYENRSVQKIIGAKGNSTLVDQKQSIM
jgi:hypothetical protein